MTVLNVYFGCLAEVKELLVGRYSQMRTAAVKVADSSKLLKISITHLIPLALSVNESKNSFFDYQFCNF